MNWDRRICMHGIQEGLDNHSCNKCQEIAKDIGLDLSVSYIFMNTPTAEERKQFLKYHKSNQEKKCQK